MSNDESWLPYAGIGGVTLCCLGLELLGGAVILSGLTAIFGVSTGVMYVVIVSVGGLLAVLLVASYRRINSGIGHRNV